MDKNTFLQKIKDIDGITDEVERRTSLAELVDNASILFDENESLKTTNQSFEKDNEVLRQANMKLFLQVGEPKSNEKVLEDMTGANDKEPQKRKFEDLFDEKGMIK